MGRPHLLEDVRNLLLNSDLGVVGDVLADNCILKIIT